MYKFVFALSVLLACSTLNAQLSSTVVTQNGPVAGSVSGNPAVMVFKGLPYAAPPVGENRWRAPQPVAPWSDVRPATEYGPRCVQNGFAPDAEQVFSEDCLYLNVWAPVQTPPAGVPVIVWIHAGGFSVGSGSQAMADGANLASKGAVVVSFNYRLGTFGFLAHPELTQESPNNSSGNYAMLDMIKVLEWVYDNIAAFGGDPVNITIAGESAGAQAVATLMASPLSAGLFHHAILQSSGWMGLGIGKQATLADLEKRGAEQAEKFGATSIDDLRKASTQQIFENLPTGGEINVDGHLLTKDTSLTFAASEHHPVDVLAGSNSDEAIFFGPGIQDAAAFKEYANDKYGPLAERFLALYPADSNEQANASYLKAFRDELAWQMRQLGKYQAERGLGTFIYYFNHVPPGQEERGATHGAELAYMFNQHELQPEWDANDLALGDTMASYWVTFATRTNPNKEGLPQWPPYRGNEVGNVQVLGDAAAAETNMIPSAEELEFFDAAFEQHVKGL
ncbi:MAG: carboxylesterase family protein [Pseudomonadota bacterium]